MTPRTKNRVMIMTSTIAASTILAATWFLNGSEFEDAWLYLTGFWIVLIPALDLFSKKK